MKQLIVVAGNHKSGKTEFITFCNQYIITKKSFLTKDEFDTSITKEEKEVLVSITRISMLDDILTAIRNTGCIGFVDNKSKDFILSFRDAWDKFNDGRFNSLAERINDESAPNETIFVETPWIKDIIKFKETYDKYCVAVWINDLSVRPSKYYDDFSKFDFDDIITNHPNGSIMDLKKKAILFVDNFITI